MIVLTTSANQTFSIIPIKETDASGNALYFDFTDETTKNIYQKTVTIRNSQNDIYRVGSSDLTFLKENTFYNLKVYFANTNEIIYKDRVFCTNQNKNNYTINQNSYVVPAIDNNNYITI